MIGAAFARACAVRRKPQSILSDAYLPRGATGGEVGRARPVGGSISNGGVPSFSVDVIGGAVCVRWVEGTELAGEGRVAVCLIIEIGEICGDGGEMR